jgi:hypothetical protein
MLFLIPYCKKCSYIYHLENFEKGFTQNSFKLSEADKFALQTMQNNLTDAVEYRGNYTLA